MVLNHLVGLRSLVDVPDIRRHAFNGPRVREDALLEFLLVAISKTDMVVNVAEVGRVGLGLESQLQHLYCAFVFLMGVVGETQLVQHFWFFWRELKSAFQIVDGVCKLSHIVKTLGPVHQEIYILSVLRYRLVKIVNCLFVLLHVMITLTQSVLDSRVILDCGLSLFVFNFLLFVISSCVK